MNQASNASAPPVADEAANGILASVPDEYIGRAIFALFDPAATATDEMCVDIDVGWPGRVRLTFAKHRYRRSKGKFSAVIWICGHAAALPSDAAASEV